MAAGLTEQLRQALAPSYVLERELGRGASATVFLAVDVKHGRRVALKVLHADLAASVGPQRFRREIAVSARFQHPHILSVHDSGETDGLLWFTMPFVDGESLRDRLRREGALPIADALRVAREIADALGYAHARGVVHRDVKPENVLLSEGHALLADFGVARTGVTGSTSQATTQLTEAGTAVGTPAYMSPEQLAADHAIDARTDVYALGVVLYEMLSGVMPFAGPTPQATIAKVVRGELPSLRRTRPSVPAAIEAVIRRALSPDPANRFKDGADLKQALDRAERGATGLDRRRTLAAAFGAAVVVVAGVAAAIAVSARRASGDDIPVLAILPFENQGDSSDAYFAEGVADEIRGKLTSLSGLKVIASGSTAQYAHTKKSPLRIARELGTRYLLVGRVNWQRDSSGTKQVRVWPELVKVDDDQPVDAWSAEFDARLSDVFSVQAHIAALVADTLRVTLRAGERAGIDQQPTGNLDAYDAYLRGKKSVGSVTAADQRLAIQSFRRAVTIDPRFASAWAALAEAYTQLAAVSEPPPRAITDSARLAAERAIDTSPTLPEAHAALAYYDVVVAHDLAGAAAEIATSRARAPHDAALIDKQAYIEERLGRWTDAVAHFDTAAQLDPRDAAAPADLGFGLIYTHRIREAIGALDRALTLDPTNLTTIEWRIMASLSGGDLAGARMVVRSVPASVDRSALVAYLASYRALAWVLDSGERQLLVTLRPAAFDNERGAWGLAVADGYFLTGDSARGRTYADSARIAFEGVLNVAGGDEETRLDYALALSFLGRREDAQREAGQVLAAPSAVSDGRVGPFYLYELAEIDVRIGQLNRALDVVAQLVARPGYVTKGWVAIDPAFAPLRSHLPAL